MPDRSQQDLSGSRATRAALVAESRRRDARRRRRVKLLAAFLAVAAAASALLAIAALPNSDEDGQRPRATSATPRDAGVNYGLVVHEGAPDRTVDVYYDFDCPGCASFFEKNGEVLERAADQGFQVTHHPVAFLAATSRSRYSERAMNVALCIRQVGGSDAYLVAMSRFFEELPGLDDDRRPRDSHLLRAADGLPQKEEVRECVEGRPFRKWISAASSHFIEAAPDGLRRVPLVEVNGRLIGATAPDGRPRQPTPSELAQALASG